MRLLHIHALGINTGGGLVLLRQILKHNSGSFGRIILDERLKAEFSNLPNAVFYKHGIAGEIKSQLDLRKKTSDQDHILFFSNRPPILKFDCKVSVYHQNALVLEHVKIKDINQFLRKIWFHLFKKNAHQYFVQNQSMRRLLSKHGCHNTAVISAAFFDFKKNIDSITEKEGYVYVASFMPHKNHKNLIKAWEYLIYQGVEEKLKLIVSGANASGLRQLVNQSHISKYITVLSDLTSDQVLIEYKKNKALIFPSYSESFGLPILEAKRCGLQILASERDYVRDIVDPDQSFDPDSYTSIARAVMRHLKFEYSKSKILTSEEFVNILLEKTKVSVPKAS